MSDKTEIWDSLSKTAPTHVKGFKRSGGFEGTAIRPMYTWGKLTQYFGPFGIGWGCNEPSFQIVNGAEGEVLVYCTISAWYGKQENILWGVGGDKIVSKNKYGLSSDDEAFKKAFTDALGNAFKFIGCSADVHMGLFEDSKYVGKLEAEFSEKKAKPDPKKILSSEDLISQQQALYAAKDLDELKAIFLSAKKLTDDEHQIEIIVATKDERKKELGA